MMNVGIYHIGLSIITMMIIVNILCLLVTLKHGFFRKALKMEFGNMDRVLKCFLEHVLDLDFRYRELK